MAPCGTTKWRISIAWVKDNLVCVTVGLKFVAGPQRPVVEIAPRQRGFDERPSMEDPVVSLKPQMAIRLPLNLCARPVSNQPRTAPIRGCDQESRNCVHTILKALAPLKNPIGKDGYPAGSLKLNFWVNVHKIQGPWTGGSEHAKVVPAQVQRIEGSERVAVRVVSTRNVSVHTEPRFQGRFRELISRV